MKDVQKVKPFIRFVRFILFAMVVAVSFFAGVYVNSHTNTPSPILDAVSIDIRPDTIYASDIEKAVNNERSKNGLHLLTHSNELTDSACRKLDDMVTDNYWAHKAPDGTEPWYFFREVDYKYVTAGENLAYGQHNAPELVSSWMNSPTHKANIVGDYTEFGICSRVVKYRGNYHNLIVNHFGTPY